MTKRVVLYVRISRDRVGAGLGVDRQEEDCRALATQRGWTVVTTHRDNDLSAYSGKPRPGYIALLDDLRTGRADAVISWHTDRLHRSPVELEEYISVCDPRGVPTVTVKAGPLDLSTPSGRMVARQLGAVARYEVEHAIERQQRAKLQSATDGRWKGGRRPFGYADDGVSVVDEEAAIVLAAANAVVAGASLNSLATQLNAAGIPTSTGRPWRQDGVRKVLLRPRNAGLMEHQGQVIGPAVWPAIVPEDTWRAVVAVLSDPARRLNWSTARVRPGGGLYVDGVCGAFVRSSRETHSHLPLYVCTAAKHLTRNAPAVDGFVGDVVVERLSRPDAIDLLRRDESGDTTALYAKASALRGRLKELAGMYADEVVDAQQLREGSERMRLQLAEIETAIGNASRGSVLADLVGQADVQAAWDRLDVHRRRAVIDTLMVVTLLPSPKGRPTGWRAGHSYFRPETVHVDWRA